MFQFKKPDFTPVKAFLSAIFSADRWGLDTSRPAPALDGYVTQLDAALKTQSTPEKVSALLALDETAQSALGELSAKANKNAAASLGAGLLALAATAASLAL